MNFFLEHNLYSLIFRNCVAITLERPLKSLAIRSRILLSPKPRQVVKKRKFLYNHWIYAQTNIAQQRAASPPCRASFCGSTHSLRTRPSKPATRVSFRLADLGTHRCSQCSHMGFSDDS